MNALRFQFYPDGFENCRGPCIVRDDPGGGDPLIVAMLGRIYHNDELFHLCSAANERLEQRADVEAQQ